jgi:hypothetical protein
MAIAEKFGPRLLLSPLDHGKIEAGRIFKGSGNNFYSCTP